MDIYTRIFFFKVCDEMKNKGRYIVTSINDSTEKISYQLLKYSDGSRCVIPEIKKIGWSISMPV